MSRTSEAFKPPLAVVCCLATAMLVAPAAVAQQFTGRIDVTVVDGTGGVLPGALVSVEGPQSASAVSNAIGQVALLNLTVGQYRVNVSLDGFNPSEIPGVTVETGGSVPLRVTLGVGPVTEDVRVTVEIPVVDTKKLTAGTLVSYDELQLLPTARDPWVVLQTVPGIVVDRVNVGGSESGQQSTYIGRGANDEDNTWNLDGIPVTDMAAAGSSSFYYDHDIFEEMNVVTGGAEITNKTPGVQLNGTIKSGTNVHRSRVSGERGAAEQKPLQGAGRLDWRDRGRGESDEPVRRLRLRRRRPTAREQMVGLGPAGAD